jgi:protein gp37
MAAETKIEWCDSTFNPWRICTPVGPGCKNCYAATLAKAFGWGEYKQGVPRHRHSPEKWAEPVKWNAKPFYECGDCHHRFPGAQLKLVTHGGSAANGCPRCGSVRFEQVRRRVFCLSLGDWLDNEVPIEWLVDLMEVVRLTPNLDYLMLTKRIGLWRKRIEESVGFCYENNRHELGIWLKNWLRGFPPENVWLGATIVDRVELRRDGRKLKEVPATIRFWSMEPLIEDLGEIPLDLIPDWGIVGGESGNGNDIRHLLVEWVRSIRDQFGAAGKKLLFKQWGEWLRADFVSHALADEVWVKSGKFRSAQQMRDAGLIREFSPPLPSGPPTLGCNHYLRVGKDRAGNELDGRQYLEFPA